MQSSGAEYLDELHLQYMHKYKDLPEALESLAKGQSNAVVNSVWCVAVLRRQALRQSSRDTARSACARLHGDCAAGA